MSDISNTTSNIPDFKDTIKWAYEEDKLRSERGETVSTFLLILSVIIILTLIIFILYLANKSPKKSNLKALDIMKDEKYIYDDDYSGEYEEYADGEEADGELEQEEGEYEEEFDV